MIVRENRSKLLTEGHKRIMALDQSALLDLFAQATLDIHVYGAILDARPPESCSPEDFGSRPKRLDGSTDNELQLLQLR